MGEKARVRGGIGDEGGRRKNEEESVRGGIEGDGKNGEERLRGGIEGDGEKERV